MRERFLEGTSNPSDIKLALGGVGYRIFSNISAPKRFITALGADPISKWAREALEADGDVSLQVMSGRDAGPPLYLALMESGNLKVAASDFRIVEQALSAGQAIFGESKVQEAKAKKPLCPERLRWHLSGHLQSNKCRDAVGLFEMAIDRIANSSCRYQQCLAWSGAYSTLGLPRSACPHVVLIVANATRIEAA